MRKATDTRTVGRRGFLVGVGAPLGALALGQGRSLAAAPPGSARRAGRRARRSSSARSAERGSDSRS